jgi:hypothetical protein
VVRSGEDAWRCMQCERSGKVGAFDDPSVSDMAQ